MTEPTVYAVQEWSDPEPFALVRTGPVTGVAEVWTRLAGWVDSAMFEEYFFNSRTLTPLTEEQVAEMMANPRIGAYSPGEIALIRNKRRPAETEEPGE